MLYCRTDWEAPRCTLEICNIGLHFFFFGKIQPVFGFGSLYCYILHQLKIATDCVTKVTNT